MILFINNLHEARFKKINKLEKTYEDDKIVRRNTLN